VQLGHQETFDFKPVICFLPFVFLLYW